MKLLLRPEARADALDAFHWYEERSPGLGREFRIAIDKAIQRLLRHPNVYREHHRGLRHALVRRFPYAIYFRVFDDVVVVVGILHAKRNPSIAKAR